MKHKKRFAAALLILSILLSLCTVYTLAAEEIDTDRNVILTISYHDDDVAISETDISIYLVAAVDEHANLVPVAPYDAYPIDLNLFSQEQWSDLAVTLKGYTQRDQLIPEAKGKTKQNGELTVTLTPGLYLVLIDDHRIGEYRYTAAPFMILLPDYQAEDHTWDYEVEARPKYAKGQNPGTLARKALKIWDDAGYEDLRPENIAVQLLQDGVPVDEQLLSEQNQWRFEWTDLDANCDWTVVEKEAKNYYTTVDFSGITFTITNRYIVPLAIENPPVAKKIIGDKPEQDSTFTFVLTAQDAETPMPEGSNGTVKETTITGSGRSSFGDISITEPGTYIYTITEKNTGLAGYTYDTSVYYLIYIADYNEGKLTVERIIEDVNGDDVESPVFTNSYHVPESKLPYTGIIWWPVPLLFTAGFAIYILGVTRKRMNNGKKM